MSRHLPKLGFISEPGYLLVGCAVLFNFGLCFTNTVGLMHITNIHVVVIEAVQMLIALFIVRHHAQQAVPITVLLGLYLLAMKLINPYLDLKLIHDLAIMYIYFLLGRMSSSHTVSATLWSIIAVVLLVAAFELLLTDTYSQYFNIWTYYVDKGAVGADVINYGNSSMFVSANRGEGIGRSFFPGLFGAHRVSSVFLEPVGMGNFATILFAWGLCGRFTTKVLRLFLLAIAILCIILGDSRFGAACCAAMLIFRLSLAWRSKTVVFLLPTVGMVVLLCFGAINMIPGQEPTIMSDDFRGRLMFSGRLLAFWTWPEWLAFQPSSVYVADTGYAYIVNGLGLLPATMFLALYSSIQHRNIEATLMKAMISLYFATGLCIGASGFTIKTGSLMWFLYGAAAALPAVGTTRLSQNNPAPAAERRHLLAVK